MKTRNAWKALGFTLGIVGSLTFAIAFEKFYRGKEG